MKKIIGTLCVLTIFATAAHATEYIISGNGSGSDNSIEVNSNSETTIEQNNQGSFTNDIDASANTGGNDTDGGSVETGDASVLVRIRNFFNSNSADVDCCPEGVTPTPSVYDPGQPTPTPTTPPTGGGNGGGGNGGGGGGVGGPGGEILGLSAASGQSEIFFYALGSLCLALGGALVRHPKKLLA